MSTKPRSISEFIPAYDRDWTVVGRARECECGHPHYPRRPDDKPEWAPRWHFCEDRECDCRMLRPKAAQA